MRISPVSGRSCIRKRLTCFAPVRRSGNCLTCIYVADICRHRNVQSAAIICAIRRKNFGKEVYKPNSIFIRKPVAVAIFRCVKQNIAQLFIPFEIVQHSFPHIRKRSLPVIKYTHRLKTVEAADRILVMDEGRLAAQGPHDALVRKSALYRRMVEANERRDAWDMAAGKEDRRG